MSEQKKMIGSLKIVNDIIVKRLERPEIIKNIPISRLLSYQERLIKSIAFVEGITTETDTDGAERVVINEEIRAKLRKVLGEENDKPKKTVKDNNTKSQDTNKN